MKKLKDLFDKYRNRLGVYGAENPTIGQIHKKRNDELFNLTFWNDLQSKVCYIYDYKHDDQPDKNDHITHKNTTKTKVACKFYPVQDDRVTKDQTEYHVQFYIYDEPNEYEKGLYEETFGKNATYPMGMYIDIPNSEGVYQKWMIVRHSYRNQYPDYSVFPCGYRYQWIHNHKKMQMWGVLRSQNSYNSGKWEANYTTTAENQSQMWLPKNEITDTIYYNQRFLISDRRPIPLAWEVSKIIDVNPYGVVKFTLTQEMFNHQFDYVDDEGMWADYFKYAVEPTEPTEPAEKYGELVCKQSVIKVRGNKRTISFIAHDGELLVPITLNETSWSFNIPDVILDFSDDYSSVAVKLPDNDELIGTALVIDVADDAGEYTAHLELGIEAL